MKILVTGGAGFIGLNLVEGLTKKNKVIVFDNFSAGKEDSLKEFDCDVIKGDILNPAQLLESMRDIDEVYHFAADPRVKESFDDPIGNFKQDCVGTVNVLEAARKSGVKKVVFASSSVVYGKAEMPTPETAPIRPISNYGAAKAASENYIMSYSDLYGIQGVILRLANIIGLRSTHGVTVDFYKKLKKNPNQLEILGDGTQEKSYLHVEDTVKAAIFAAGHSAKPFDIFNIGTNEQITVKKLADLGVREMGLKGVEYNYTGGSIGWPGDVPKMLLSTEKLENLGWKPKHTLEEAVLDTIRHLKKEAPN